MTDKHAGGLPAAEFPVQVLREYALLADGGGSWSARAAISRGCARRAGIPTQCSPR